VNSRLKDAIAKAKANNVPNENIERIIKKAAGGDGGSYEEMVYEGYGPSGVAVIVETLSDNRNRTASDMRHYFDKFGGNLGPTGCVSSRFARQGVLAGEVEGVDEEALMEAALAAGASDFLTEDGVFDVRTEPAAFGPVRDALEAGGYVFLSAEVEYVPSVFVTLTKEEDVKNMTRLLEHFEENDDVQNVWHNWENADDTL
jgi:YebC/PmpR family DNA-binding regulatory protein